MTLCMLIMSSTYTGYVNYMECQWNLCLSRLESHTQRQAPDGNESDL